MWGSVLDYFPFNSTSEERRRIDEDRKCDMSVNYSTVQKHAVNDLCSCVMLKCEEPLDPSHSHSHVHIY